MEVTGQLHVLATLPHGNFHDRLVTQKFKAQQIKIAENIKKLVLVYIHHYNYLCTKDASSDQGFPRVNNMR
jgi:hypothetical protein